MRTAPRGQVKLDAATRRLLLAYERRYRPGDGLTILEEWQTKAVQWLRRSVTNQPDVLPVQIEFYDQVRTVRPS